MGIRCDGEVAYSASDSQGSNFESCVWRSVSSHSSHHPQEVLQAQFSLYVHNGGLKPRSFHFIFISAHTISFAEAAYSLRIWSFYFYISAMPHQPPWICGRLAIRLVLYILHRCAAIVHFQCYIAARPYMCHRTSFSSYDIKIKLLDTGDPLPFAAIEIWRMCLFHTTIHFRHGVSLHCGRRKLLFSAAQ